MARHKVEELTNHHIGVERGKVPDAQATQALREVNPGTEEVVMMDYWIVVLTDRDSGDQIRMGLTRKGRDGLVRDLTGGIVLAGGELPQL